MIFEKRFTVYIKPGSSNNKYIGLDYKQRHVISLKQKAQDNKANIALIKFLKKEYNITVIIKHGLKSQEKVLEIKEV
ncbi:MAG: DUF167 domain-containing protein [Candidatus Woesearchaeota archaeon]